MNFLDGAVERGGAGGQAHGFVAGEPFRVEVGGALDVNRGNAALAAAGHQLAGIVGVAAADHDHRLDLVQQPLQRLLMVLGGVAHGVDETNLGVRIQPGDGGADLGYVVGRRRRLAHDAEPSVRITADFLGDLNHVETVQVLDDALDLDMAATADDQDVETVTLKLPGGFMGAEDERTPQARGG